MPLFNFECKKCESIVEKFQKGKEAPEIECAECGHTEFKKLFGACHNRKRLDAKEFYNEKIAPDAQRIMKEMGRKDNHFLDVYGEK